MKTRILSLIFCIFFFMIFFSAHVPTASSQIYKWTDENGNVRFSDSPPTGVKVQKVQGYHERSNAEATAVTPGTALKSEKGGNRNVKVILYMTDWCPYCRKAREYLQSLKVDLVEYNVEKDRQKAVEFKSKGGSGVPLIDVGGIVIKGYNQGSIQSAVEEKRRR